MNIVLNGESQQVPDNITAAQLVETLGLEGKRLAMEVNMEIVPRSTFQEFVIHPDDRVEIVHAIGGG
jgi:sulfur carrier protein